MGIVGLQNLTKRLSEPNLLVIYAKRWRIECLFAKLKSRGFNVEDTHFTGKDRIGNWIKLIVLALIIVFDSWARSIDKKDEHSCYHSVDKTT